MKLELFDDDGNYIPNPSEPRPIEGEPMTNKEWLATLSAEDFYKEFKRAEEVGKRWTSTSGFVIQWLDEERRADDRPTEHIRNDQT